MNHESVSLFNVNLTFKRRQTSFIYSKHGGHEKRNDREDEEMSVCGIHKVPIHSCFMILTQL